MIELKGGHTTDDIRLDRVPSDTTEHLERFPLTAATMPDEPSSMAIGVNWYSNFDDPVAKKVGRRTLYVIGEGELGRVRGGHSVCLPHARLSDAASWWAFYNQLKEGRCVHFATMRVLSQRFRRRFAVEDRRPYWEMQRIDEWAGGSYPGASPVYEGTSVRAALDVVLKFGMVTQAAYQRASRRGAEADYDARCSIAAYRWATTWDDVRTALEVPADQAGVDLVNSWGKDYPRSVRLTDEAGARLLAEDGEFGIVTSK